MLRESLHEGRVHRDERLERLWGEVQGSVVETREPGEYEAERRERPEHFPDLPDSSRSE